MIVYCANCKKQLDTEIDEILICKDNFLQTRYFDDNKSNRFCSLECFAEALFLQPFNYYEDDELPLDSDEIDEEDETSFSEFDV